MESGAGAIFGLQFSELVLKKLLGNLDLMKAVVPWKRTWVDKSKRPTTRMQKKFNEDNPKLGLDIEDTENVENAISEQGADISYEELLNFIPEYPTRESYKRDFRKREGVTEDPSFNILSKAQAQFEKLTGLKATAANIKKFLASKEGAAQQRAETAIFEAERLQEEESRRKDVESRVEEKNTSRKT